MKHESLSKCVDRDSKLEQNVASSKSIVKPTCAVLQNKPFKGRIFYIDLPWNKRTQNLESDIKSLGGTVERFFSKEIKYLVSSKPEARYAQRLLPDSPAPSPDSGVSSPHPSSKRDIHVHRGSSQGPTDTATVSRGKSLVERVVKEQSQERIQMNGILANALEWGVKVLHVDDVISYIEKRKAKTISAKKVEPVIKGPAKIKPPEKSTFLRHRAGRISRPFVKVEDSSRHYRPIYLPMTNMPICNLQSAPPCSPFLMEEHGKDDAKKKLKEERSGGDRGARGKKDKRRGQDGREKRKGGYCECCEVKFDNLKAHLDGTQHQTFSKSEEYAVVDRVIAGLTCDLADIGTHSKRVKCSVSTPLLHAETIRVAKEDIVALAGDGKPKSEGFLHLDSTAKHSLSDQTREKSLLVRKRSRGQYDFPWSNRDSLLDPSDLEKSQSKRGSFELEFRSQSVVRTYERRSLLSGEKNCASYTLEYRTDHDMNPGQHFSDGNVESIPGRECFRTNFSDMYTNSVLENRAENSTFWPLASTEPDLDSPYSSLQRKVRNVRPRRKETPNLHIQSSKEGVSLTSQSPVRVVQQHENTSVCALDLWQLFQYSDDMDEDFKGFSDQKQVGTGIDGTSKN
ncbi:Protein DBF4 -like protein A [Triplophysa tibetana]|uniref:Protein DBF4 homolog A n=1 Tax=Triplophysa tibetana TaxID=1572043 RepID=A0A5A9MYJ3_9TELE|nr:Protein DBF4 -like protein A [Triplophysa tibetana]